MLEPCKSRFYTIMANYNWSLEAVDCYTHIAIWLSTWNKGV